MNPKSKTFVRVALLLVALALLAWKFFAPSIRDPQNGLCDFDTRLPVEKLVYVEHAKCRMRCRNIDKQLAEKVYLRGEGNCQKSSIKNGKHRYALEKRDDRGDVIRLIVEDDDGQHVIITAIRLDRADKCSCS